jgi:hypothetical protein
MQRTPRLLAAAATAAGAARPAATASSAATAAAPKRKLTRTDFMFAFMVGYVFIPAGALLYFNQQVRIWATPYLLRAQHAWEDVEPEVYLSLERLAGRDGEVSEGLRRRNAERRGEPYVPVVTPGRPVAPSRADVTALTDGGIKAARAARYTFNAAPATDSPAAAVAGSAGGGSGVGKPSASAAAAVAAAAAQPREPLPRALASGGGGSVNLDALVAAAEAARRAGQPKA